MTKEKQIELYMKKLDLSREEAEQMWLDEQEDNLPELTPEQKAVVKEMAQADRKKETAPRKRERKPDTDKRHLMNLIGIAIGYNPDVTDYTVLNAEREVYFRYNGMMYKLTLTKTREKKE